MEKRTRVGFLNILSTCLLYGISIITAPLFSRLLGTGGYGNVSNYNVWVSILSIAATLQTQATLANAMVEYPESLQDKYQSSVLSLSFLAFAVVSALILLFLNPISHALNLSKFFILLVLFQSIGTYGVNFMNRKLTYEMKAGRNMLLSLGTTLATLGLSLLFVLMLPQELRYYGRIVAIAAVYGLLGLGLCVFIWAKGRTFYNREFWRFCIPLAIPYVFYNLADLLLGHCDVIMLRQMIGDSVSGIYSMAFQLGTVLYTIFTALNNTWVPFFYEDTKQGNGDAVRSSAKNYLELFTVLSAGFILLGTEVYHLFADRSFWGSTNLVPLFALSHYLNFLCTFPITYEQYHKQVKMVAAATIVSSSINILLNYLLIPPLGMLGAALATVLSHGLQFAAHYIATRFFLGKENYPFGITLCGKYALYFGVVLLLVYLLPNAWLIRWGLGAVIGIWELLRIRKRKALI